MNPVTRRLIFLTVTVSMKPMARPPALKTLAALFSLSEFEQNVLLLCAGFELDSQFALSLGSTPYPRPCFGLALSLFADGHWSAATPAGALRHWRLIDLVPGNNLISSTLRIDERILHYLTGISYIDTRLQGLLEAGVPPPTLAPSLRECAGRLVKDWLIQQRCGRPLRVQLSGQRNADMIAVARNACEGMNLVPYHLDDTDIPVDHIDREALAILWQRESLLEQACLIIRVCEQGHENTCRFVDKVNTPCILIGREPAYLGLEALVRIDVPASDSSEQLALWHAALGDSARHMNGALDHIVSQFSFSAEDIDALSQHSLLVDDPDNVEQVLWQQCRMQSRRPLDNLAEKIESSHEFSDLVLPEAQAQTLRDIISFARHRHQVYNNWKFGASSKRGRGGSCLFYGPSGTGKTMAASVIANELQLDLYRVDLSQVINKYIGETEKNIARIFNMAENSGAILLFDEADSLFAKRTEVKSSNDRHANVATGFLLQKMENYSGLAVLTTNQKKALDTAFMRRIRFAVQFPFPDEISRKQIWIKVFPDGMLRSGIDVGKLAKLDIAGGNIRNIALNAAFYAADQGQPVAMTHLARATRCEFEKLEKPVRENELRGWV